MRTVLAGLLLVAVLACRGNDVTSDGATVPGIPEALKTLAGKRVYFGHQSVGYDIVRGLQAIAGEHPAAGLEIVEGRSGEALGGPAFAHARNGKNEEPLTKIRDFAATLEQGGLGAKADIALFKFCYVDFTPESDVEKLFAEYRAALDDLRRKLPTVQFVHVTAPLTVVQSGPKAFVKRLLGRKLGGAAANVARERFNALMREAYAGREPLFDLAAVESTLPDGRRVTFRDGDASYPALAAEYASDGRHLNAAGARWAAAHLIEALASAAR